MSTQPASLTDLLGVLLKEARRRTLMLAAVFSVTALIALVVVLMMPKKYEASTLIIVEANTIMKPLMEGRAVPTSIADQTAVINQLVLGRKTMRELLVFGGWLPPPDKRQPDPREAERLLNKVRGRIRIDTKEELVRISFADNDPKRAYLVANKLAEVYLRESTAGKERESREAFEFIDKQVKEYGEKLADIHEKVLAQYRGTATTVITHPAGTPRPTVQPKPISISPEELAELRAEETMLQRQLGRKADKRVEGRSEEQARARVQQLQQQLDQLLLSFTDEHPDVRRVKRELSAARDELKVAEQATAEREAAAQLDDDVAKATRAHLEDVQRRIAAATGRPMPRPRGPTVVRRPTGVDPTDPEMRGVGRDTTLSELLRRYEATRDIYQDLLKRRENARVSMELDAQHRGFNVRVQEPAEIPLTASGLRLMHLSAIGLVVSVLVPFGLLFAIVRLDRRVRSPIQVQRIARVPLLGSISEGFNQRQKARARNRGLLAAAMVVGVFMAYAAAFLIKLKTSS